MFCAQEPDKPETMSAKTLKPGDKTKTESDDSKRGDADADGEAQRLETDGDVVMTHGAERGPEAAIYTTMANLEFTAGELDIEQLRSGSWRAVTRNLRRGAYCQAVSI